MGLTRKMKIELLDNMVREIIIIGETTDAYEYDTLENILGDEMDELRDKAVRYMESYELYVKEIASDVNELIKSNITKIA